MNLDLDTVVPHIIFECIAGSKAYGLDTPSSDTDLRGVFFVPDRVPKSDALFPSIYDLPPELVKDHKGDMQYYRLDRFLSLASNVNPSMIELLFMPEDVILKMTPSMMLLRKNADAFISSTARDSFGGYAIQQIKKAKGQNKWVNNPQPDEMPDKLDFCKFIDTNYWKGMYTDPSYLKRIFAENVDNNVFPFRPVPIKDYLNLDMFHASKQEGMQDVYRLYSYCHDNPRGVFRGPSQQLVLESIPKEEEWERFFGLMIFNEQEWKKAVKNWQQYHEWRENRNEERWVTQESGEMDYDAKNMMHCMRLLWSGINILETGRPIIRFDGKRHEMLMDIRRGKYQYEEIMKHVDELDEKLMTMPSNVGEKISYERIEMMYQQIIKWSK